jgi:hypothetical protein
MLLEYRHVDKENGLARLRNKYFWSLRFIIIIIIIIIIMKSG